MNRPLALRTAAAVALAATLSTSHLAHAGPTAAVDLDLGTSIQRDRIFSPIPSNAMVGPSPLYVAGFRVRAGWRFDIGPFWVLPELGAGYDRERFDDPADPGINVPRAFGGARTGVSLPLTPALRLEPSVYGHAGWARYGYATEAPRDGVATDLGFALDFRFLRYFIVGAHVGYDVVTTWQPVPPSGYVPPLMCGHSAFGMMTCTSAPPSSPASYAYADKWLAYGVHAGVLFW